MTCFANRIVSRVRWSARGVWVIGLSGFASLLVACAPVAVDQVPIEARADTRIMRSEPLEPSRSTQLLTTIMAAELALSRGALAQASDYYAQAARVSPDPRVSERAVQLALSLDNRPRTTRLLKRWLSLDADQFDARQLLAVNQLRSNQPDQALATLQAGMPRSQEAREAALASISRLFQDPSLPASVIDLMQSLSEDYTNSPAAALGLARVGLARERFDLAQQAVSAALDKRPEWTTAQLLQADLLRRTNQSKAALAAYQDVIQTSEPGVQTYLDAAQLAIDLGASVSAQNILSQAIEQHPERAPLRYVRAISWMLDDQVAAAEADFRWLLQRQPNNPRVLNALGYTLVDQTERIDEGHALIARAYALEPDNAAIIDSMGWAEFRQGRIDSALGYLRRAYEKAPDNAEIAAHLGEVLWVQGDKTAAKKVWADARERSSDDAVLLETLERLLP